MLKPNNIPSNFFEPGCTASTIATDFQIKDLLSFDANRKVTGSDSTYIAGWNQHDYYYFIGVTGFPLTLEYLMTLSTTETQFTAWVEQIEQSKTTHLPYSIREMGIVGPVGMDGTSDVFGGAIWTMNFLLYASSLDISSVQFHMTDNSKASAWQPIEMDDMQPSVRPIYYGMAAFDQVMGSGCSAQVSRPKVKSYPAEYEDFIRTYTVYHGGQLDSLVVINGKVANISEPNKASVDVSLKVPSSLSGQVLHLSYLTSDGADATTGTTWDGMSYEESGDGTPTYVSNEDITAQVGSDGTVTFSVRDSEAVVATIGRRVADQAQCGTNGGRTTSSPEDSDNHGGRPQPQQSPLSSLEEEEDVGSAAPVGCEVLGGSLLLCMVAAIIIVASGFTILG